MIIDTLDNASAYETLGPRFAKAFEYLRSGRAATDVIGTHKLDGDDVFVSVQAYNTKLTSDCRWEAHQTYADVQFVVDGCERMGYAAISAVKPEQPYDAKNDVAFFTGEGTQLRVPAGTFTVFLPQDVHMPCIADNGKPAPVRKVVVKVRIG
ncbi:MAG: YhcH/YjgK/YiaL family protein [Phycisphaerales bacterium]